MPTLRDGDVRCWVDGFVLARADASALNGSGISSIMELVAQRKVSAKGGVVEKQWKTEQRSELREETPSDVQLLMQEFNEDPGAYMDRRGRALQPDALYAVAREQIIAERNAALRSFGRRVLERIRHPFSARGGNSERTESA